MKALNSEIALKSQAPSIYIVQFIHQTGASIIMDINLPYIKLYYDLTSFI